MDELENILSCSICMEIFESPRQLPCQHTYCTPCLSDHITKKKKINGKKNQTFACPLCRAEVKINDPPYDATLFPINLAYQSILDSKELMKTLEECITLHDTQPKQNVMGKIKKYLCTRSKATQTEPLFSNNGNKTGKTNRNPASQEGLSTNDNLGEFLSFSSLQIYNIYHPVFKIMVVPLISGQCSSLRKGITIILTILLSLFCTMMILADFFQKEIGSLVTLLLIVTLLIQLSFVRLKLHFSRTTSQAYVLIGYFVTYIFTLFIVVFVFMLFCYIHCNFVVMQKYAFKKENFTIWTPYGFQTEEKTVYNGRGNINKNFVDSKRHTAMQDYMLYLNFHIYEIWQANYEDAKMIIPILAAIFFLGGLLIIIINPALLTQQVQYVHRRHRN